jgi:beta-galactosidase
LCLAAAAAATTGAATTAAAAPEASSVRLTMPLNSGWGFRPASAGPNDWTPVAIPHTWNRIGNAGTERSSLSNDVQGVGWYQLHFAAPHAAADSRYFLQFDGVGAVADVWLNGVYLGKHAGAFARFRFDVSASIDTSGDNLLVVKADNSRPEPGASTEDVIPLSGDFFVFGGIYREVALLVTRAVHADLLDFGGPGLYVQTLDLNAKSSTVLLAGKLVSDAPEPRRVSVEFAIEDADGLIVAKASLDATASAKPSELQTQLHVPQPRLWRATEDPYLYHAVMTIRAQGQILDRVVEPFGIRTVKLDPDRGFFLNGEHLSLRGVSMHQDRPVKGWAISRADQKQDFDLLQELGANAVRLAHYQHDQYSYEQADARGIVTWAEIPLVNKVSFDGSAANAALSANARQQLTELIRQNSNHPSIAVWSIGNEIDLTATQTGMPSRPGALLRSLNDLAKREDPTRPTTFADCCETGIPPHNSGEAAGSAAREVIVGMADSIGYNRYFGWYTGQLEDFGPMLDAAHAHHPQLPIAVAEYGAGAALTQHSDNPAGGPINPHGRPHPEEYQNRYHEESWAALEPRPYLWGVFIWNLFDFSSNSRNEGDLTDINDKGLVSYDRQTRKDSFYFYRANWNVEPTLHLVGRRHVDRDYAVIDVKAYSNATQAALTVNGNAIGVAPCVRGICLWHGVHLKSGVNDLQAEAQIAGRAFKDSLRWALDHSEASVNIKSGDISGYQSADSRRFGSDMYFEGGIAQGINPPDTATANRVSVRAADTPLYDSFREGSFIYRVPLPKGRYRVQLNFVEPKMESAGARVFDVIANGVTALRGFDIFVAAGGKLKGVNRSFDAAVDKDVLVLEFRPRRGNALLSALSITPLDSR